MLTLLLNGQKAVIKKGTTFKFNVENQLFSEQGEYSMQVTLPLKGCPQNLNIFGNINRTECEGTEEGTFALISEIIANTGKFRVTGVDEEEVKVQLMAKKSLSNFESKDKDGNDLYIDELDLGFFYDEWNWLEQPLTEDWPPIGLKYPPKSITYYFPLIDALPGMAYWTHEKGLEHNIDGYNCTLHPMFSTADNRKVNRMEEFVTPTGSAVIIKKPICFQPTLLDLIKRISRVLGFKLVHKLSNEKQHIYVGNMTSEYLIAKILPHWTVKEFIKEVSNFLNCKFKFYEDYIEVVELNEFIKDEIIEINQVVDEYTLEIKEEDKEDFSAAGNVDYEWPVEDNMLRLPEEVWEKAIIKKFGNNQELDDFIANLKENISKSQYILVDEETKKVYALLLDEETNEYVKSRVDWYRPLIRNEKSREIQTSMKIVPIRYTLTEEGEEIMCMEEAVNKSEDFSVNDFLKPESSETQNTEKEDKRNVMEVFLWDDRISDIPLGVTVRKNPTKGLMELIPFKSYSGNIDKRGPFVLENMFNESNIKLKIDTRKEYLYKFIKEGSIDIDKTFLINNQKYICRKLEYDCDEKGVKPLVQGYFYRIN